MEDFSIYFQLGIHHILSLGAMDHILFVTALCLRYLYTDWKKVLILVTAFTIGHSITLALSALDYIHFPTDWIEFFIPLTIAATCVNNLLQPAGKEPSKLPWIYFFALFFGLIHGLAFANEFLSLVSKDQLVSALLAFNIGIELAQLLVVVAVLLLSLIVVNFSKWLLTRLKVRSLIAPQHWWLKIASLVILVFSLIWAYERFPDHKKTHDENVITSGSSRCIVIV